ncbi:MAG: rhodanese-like domain-containing protein [Acidobacteria bacterium]|nr:rhodanese-like domain-containing protein [Acidobacteriota bacterium]
MSEFFPQADHADGAPVPLSPREAHEAALRGAVFVDIRPDFETNYRVFDVPALFNLPYRAYREGFTLLPAGEPLVVVDNVGTKSPEVARFLMANGWREVAVLVGGVVAWAQDGLPLARDPDYELVGGCGCKLKPKKPRKEGSAVAPKAEAEEDPPRENRE